MRLREDADTQERIVERLSISYGYMLKDDSYLNDLIDRLDHLESDLVERALNAHISNIIPGRDDRPVGSFPPAVADLLGQVSSIEQQARRNKEQEATRRKYLDESDAKAARVMRKVELPKMVGGYHQKRLAVIAHLRRTAQLNFLENPLDGLAFRKVERALKQTDFQLGMAEAEEW